MLCSKWRKAQMVKNLGTALFAYARGVWKYLFRCSTFEETEVMAVYSFDAETTVRDQSFFMDFVFFLWWSKVVEEIT